MILMCSQDWKPLIGTYSFWMLPDPEECPMNKEMELFSPVGQNKGVSS